jgi:hypothetical protein
MNTVTRNCSAGCTAAFYACARFDMHALTAAHRTLPFGTIVLVGDLRSGRSLNVRINDRGPSAPLRLRSPWSIASRGSQGRDHRADDVLKRRFFDIAVTAVGAYSSS